VVQEVALLYLQLLAAEVVALEDYWLQLQHYLLELHTQLL
jgi:hypothetical protein